MVRARCVSPLQMNIICIIAPLHTIRNLPMTFTNNQSPSTNNLFIAAGIFHPEPGGPATYLHELLPALQQRDWSVRVLTYGDDPAATYPYPLTRIPRRF